jgi:cytidylate kinase
MNQPGLPGPTPPAGEGVLDAAPREDLPPRHGFQGDRGAAARPVAAPAALAIAVSREYGARGGTIARRVARQLGWQVYDQELLEYMAQDGVVRQGLLDNVTEGAAAWIEARLEELRRQGGLEDPVANMARLVLALGVQGEVVMVGRGAGCILPAATTLNVRVVAPLPDRIAYVSQWMRLSLAEAAEKLRARDQRRADFLRVHFGRSPADVHRYDMLLNSSLLGEEGCADLIVQAAHVKWTTLKVSEADGHGP